MKLKLPKIFFLVYSCFITSSCLDVKDDLKKMNYTNKIKIDTTNDILVESKHTNSFDNRSCGKVTKTIITFFEFINPMKGTYSSNCSFTKQHKLILPKGFWFQKNIEIEKSIRELNKIEERENENKTNNQQIKIIIETPEELIINFEESFEKYNQQMNIESNKRIEIRIKNRISEEIELRLIERNGSVTREEIECEVNKEVAEIIKKNTKDEEIKKIDNISADLLNKIEKILKKDEALEREIRKKTNNIHIPSTIRDRIKNRFVDFFKKEDRNI